MIKTPLDFFLWRGDWQRLCEAPWGLPKFTSNGLLSRFLVNSQSWQQGWRLAQTRGLFQCKSNLDQDSKLYIWIQPPLKKGNMKWRGHTKEKTRLQDEDKYFLNQVHVKYLTIWVVEFLEEVSHLFKITRCLDLIVFGSTKCHQILW